MSLYKGNNLISGVIPNSANQSLSNLDSAGQDKFDAKVNKSGDTMTGNLRIRKSYPAFKAENTDIRRGQTPSANYCGDTFVLTDIDGNGMGSLSQTYFTSGKHTTRLWQRGVNSDVYSVLDVGMTENDVPYCSFPNTTCCDGQWVTLNQTLISSDTSLNGSTTLNYTVNVPNDGRQYMIIVRGQLRSTNAKGNWGQLEINTGFGSFIMSQMKSEIAENNDMTTTVTVPINTVRTLRVIRNTSFHANCRNLTVVAYRRIGTNS